MFSSTSLSEYENEGVAKRESGIGCLLDRLIDVDEAKVQFMFSVPMVITNMSFYGITLVSVMYAGHIGDLELAGANLGNSWGSVTGTALMIGLSGGLETLCGQAYGAKYYKMLGIYLQSSIIISTIFSILVSIFWYFTEPVLIFLNQDPDVAKMAAIYLKFFIPGLFGFAYLQCLLRFLQTQSIVIPLVVCSIISLIVDVGLTYLLVNTLNFGYMGASLAASITFCVSDFLLVIYINYSENFKCSWNGFSWESFDHVLPNLKLAIPSAIMVCVNTEAIAYMITYGFSATVSTRVSNEIGAGNIKTAKSAVSVTLKLSCFLALTVLLFLAVGHNLWAQLFTFSPVIMREFAYMTPFLCMSILFDSAQGVLSGVARGCGWQHLAAWTNLVVFYFIGMPLTLLFGFKLGLYNKLHFQFDWRLSHPQHQEPEHKSNCQ